MKSLWIARQSRHPSGGLGEIVARVMRWDTRAANQFALAQLPIATTDAVLEIGCGHGATLRQLARRTPGGWAVGVDPSEVMVRLATRRLRRAIATGRVAVQRCEARALPFEAARFDAALAVHVLYFWPDPRVELREIRRVLRPGATLLLGFRPDGPRARQELPDTVYHLRSPEEMESTLLEAGFENIERVASPRGESAFLCLRARAASTPPVATPP